MRLSSSPIRARCVLTRCSSTTSGSEAARDPCRGGVAWRSMNGEDPPLRVNGIRRASIQDHPSWSTRLQELWRKPDEEDIPHLLDGGGEGVPTGQTLSHSAFTSLWPGSRRKEVIHGNGQSPGRGP
ncbi:MAG TPA: hypothetical protein VLN90_00785 [Thioalkalivibrio sp.]|nr:hypothetical protein [Thioalkalivibrio sp.]